MVGLAIHLPETEDIRVGWDHVRANLAYNTPLYIIGESDLPEDLTWVLLQPDNGKYVQGTTSLEKFEHPADALYIFGPDKDFLKWLPREPDHFVYIPTDTQRDMFSFMAAAVTLWDRKTKWWHRIELVRLRDELVADGVNA
jgi:hypothetical protein